MHTAKKYALRLALLCAAAASTGCDNLIQDIDVTLADFPPKLAVSASIDTDSGTFWLYFTEARSLSYYKMWQNERKKIIRKGTASLYEDDNPTPIYRIVDGGNGQGFDMSLRSGSESGFSVEHRGLTLKAGSSYKLTIEVEGYPTATATVVMPYPPAVEDMALDTEQKVWRRRPYIVNSGYGYSSDDNEFYPLNLRLTDGSRNRDYYMFRAKATTTYHHHYQGYDDVYDVATWIPVAVANRALIQDNPDLEAEELPLNAEPDVFLFYRMLISDMSFANATGAINLLLPEMYAKPTPPDLCDTASQPYEQTRTEIYISHLSPVTYEHHRSLMLQRNEVSFFTEPVSIVSNIENGYGCFAAFNTVRTTVQESCSCRKEPIYTIE
ncbi:MAG: DUF4249 domain-containing protein [Prevotellaceae bacterium]|jgi:hypothetical protein|nr:DUF4249 domain-containing protein [Prevotellaceae bacterium]